MKIYLNRQIKIKQIDDKILYSRAFYDYEDGDYVISFWTEKVDGDDEDDDGFIDPEVDYWSYNPSAGYSDDELIEAWSSGKLHDLIQTDVDKRANELAGNMPPEIWEECGPILAGFFEIYYKTIAIHLAAEKKKKKPEGPDDQPKYNPINFGITGPSFDMFSTGGAKDETFSR